MERCDHDLAFMLRYENVAWFDGSKVLVLDRRIYPTKISFVTCHDYQEVAQAIADMVTQSAGPYTLAGMGMALAARQLQDKNADEFKRELAAASYTISHARPTTANRMSLITDNAYEVALAARERGEDPAEAIFLATIDSLNRRYTRMEIVAEHLVKLFPTEGAILTQCFGETIVGMMLRQARQHQKEFRIFCAETRPYLQGARLTATVCAEMGFDTTVITDNMVGYCMQQQGIELFTSAADTIALDGHIANKIGTYQMAILAKYHQIPYFVTGIPDRDKKSVQDIVIEFRDPQLVGEMHGVRHISPEVKALYPSFDITPPHLISGVITDKGVYCPYLLNEYYASQTERFY